MPLIILLLRLSLIWPARAPSSWLQCFVTCPIIYLSRITEYFRLILYSLYLNHEISHFSEDPWFLLGNQDLDTRCAHCSSRIFYRNQQGGSKNSCETSEGMKKNKYWKKEQNWRTYTTWLQDLLYVVIYTIIIRE